MHVHRMNYQKEKKKDELSSLFPFRWSFYYANDAGNLKGENDYLDLFSVPLSNSRSPRFYLVYLGLSQRKLYKRTKFGLFYWEMTLNRTEWETRIVRQNPFDWTLKAIIMVIVMVIVMSLVQKSPVIYNLIWKNRNWRIKKFQSIRAGSSWWQLYEFNYL